MSQATPPTRPAPLVTGEKLRGAEKMARIPIKIEPTTQAPRKPSWIRASLGNAAEVRRVKSALRENALHTVCEEAACPNLGECFSKGTATFMILDGGAAHFAACIREARALNPALTIEVLVPDFRGRMDPALTIFNDMPPDVFNHNLETVPRLYKQARPGSDYDWSLDLLERFKGLHPRVPTKSGLMLGLGEDIEEIEQVMRDLRAHGVDMLTLGQYLQPSKHHLPVARFVHPDEFDRLRDVGEAMGFSHVASGPMVRSSYHADQQADGVLRPAASIA